jgi:hypothetical protein
MAVVPDAQRFPAEHPASRGRVPANLELGAQRRLVQFNGFLPVSMAELELEQELEQFTVQAVTRSGCLN